MTNEEIDKKIADYHALAEEARSEIERLRKMKESRGHASMEFARALLWFFPLSDISLIQSVEGVLYGENYRLSASAALGKVWMTHLSKHPRECGVLWNNTRNDQGYHAWSCMPDKHHWEESMLQKLAFKMVESLIKAGENEKAIQLLNMCVLEESPSRAGHWELVGGRNRI